jgi:hypothetical protein
MMIFISDFGSGCVRTVYIVYIQYVEWWVVSRSVVRGGDLGALPVLLPGTAAGAGAGAGADGATTSTLSALSIL